MYLTQPYDYSVREDICDNYLHSCGKVKDLGVLIDRKLSFEDRVIDKVNEAYSILERLPPQKRNHFLLFKSVVGSHLKFSNSVSELQVRLFLLKYWKKANKKGPKILPVLCDILYKRLRNTLTYLLT